MITVLSRKGKNKFAIWTVSIYEQKNNNKKANIEKTSTKAERNIIKKYILPGRTSRLGCLDNKFDSDEALWSAICAE